MRVRMYKQMEEDRLKDPGEDPHNNCRRILYKERQNLGLSNPARMVLWLVSRSAIIGFVGWRFWRGRVGREVFAAMDSYAEGHMGVATAVWTGLKAVDGHMKRHLTAYGTLASFPWLPRLVRGIFWDLFLDWYWKGKDCDCYYCKRGL